MVKNINIDLRGLTNWLNANLISLNTSKSEYVLFRRPKKIVDYHIKIKLNGTIITPSKSIKYLGILIDETLSWQVHIQKLNIKLSRANSMLCKIRHFVDFKTVRAIYYAIFSSHLTYCCQVWGQKKNLFIPKIFSLQRKALRIINFLPFRSDVSDIFIKSNIIPFPDQIFLTNCLLVYDHVKQILPAPLVNYFTEINSLHSHATSSSRVGKIFQKPFSTIRYGKYSIKNQCISDWNSSIKNLIQLLKIKCISNSKPILDIDQLSRTQFKNLVCDFLK